MSSINPGEICKVYNNEERPIRISWDSRDYVLVPHKDNFIPAEAAICWFGDPRSSKNIRAVNLGKDQVGFIPDRATEVRRLRIKWGAGMGGDETNFESVDVPDVRIATLEDEAITTVFDDPYGDSINATVQTISQNDDLLATVERQQRQLDALQQKLGVDATPTPTEDDIPSDDDPVERHLSDGSPLVS